jgi:hypothetical protein
MSTLLRVAEFLSLSVWLGSVVFLSFAVAPGAFAVLGSREQAGAVVGMALGRLHWIGIVCAVVFLVAHALGAKSLPALTDLAALAVVLMLLLTLASQFAVTPRIAHLRAEMKTQFGSVDAAPPGNELRVHFNRFHQYSVWLESGVLLAGLLALTLLVRGHPR